MSRITRTFLPVKPIIIIVAVCEWSLRSLASAIHQHRCILLPQGIADGPVALCLPVCLCSSVCVCLHISVYHSLVSVSISLPTAQLPIFVCFNLYKSTPVNI